MDPVSIYLQQEQAPNDSLQPVCLGVPFPRGVLASVDELSLLDEADNPVLSQADSMVLWPDGSVRWAKVQFYGANDGAKLKQYRLVKDCTHHAIEPVSSPVAVKLDCVDGSMRFALPNTGHALEIVLQDAQSQNYSCVDCTLSMQQTGSVVSIAELNASFKQNRHSIRLTVRIEYFAQMDAYRFTSTVHNPKAAGHENALWDLGDQSSLSIKEFGISIKHFEQNSPSSNAFKLSRDSEWALAAGGEFSLLQASSGSENWNHPNHVNADGEVDLAFRGYRWQTAGESGEGLRAEPVLRSRFEGFDWLLAVEDFWQNFPIAVESDNAGLAFKAMANSGAYVHELQGGERKTYRMWLVQAANEDVDLSFIDAPLNARLEPEYIAATRATDAFALQGEPLDRIIALGIDAEHGFAAKRDLIDEYGWRNFGDIVADHESHYLDDGKFFVSHYNNQYDPLYGLLRQYLIRGDGQWLSLANQLARHVSDIDIYHTQQDRAEYNHGLFWHTDHYLDAYSATHRTYSRHQLVDGEVTGGGGPGDQHCYSRGLAWHYLLTGDATSAGEVTGLAAWVEAFIDGDGGVLSTLHHWRERTQYGKLLGDEVFKQNRYSMDRGTGNFVNALLDSYLVTADVSYLAKAAYVIENTFSAADDIAQRQFHDVEHTWFYTVFLQSVIRYIEISACDFPAQPERYAFSFAALLHYADWMTTNERPAMESPDALDFPNETWDAQEIRKAFILFYVAGCLPDDAHASALKQSAQDFYSHVLDVIGGSDCGHYSRILAILMQNHGLYGYASKVSYTYQDTLPKRFAPVAAGLIGELLSAVLRLSPARELKWLSHRFSWARKLYRANDD